MAENRYYWLKLHEDFFNSKRIKKLRKIAGGDTYTIIYLKMQLMAMKRDGILEYTGLEPTFAEELALDLDEEADNVAVTIQYLLGCGLLEPASDASYFLPFAVINTGSEGSSAKRVRDYRERQREQKALHSNEGVTQVLQERYGEIEREKEIEIELEREDTPTATRPGSGPTPYEKVKQLYNDLCVSFPKCKVLSEARKKAIKARFTSGYTLEDFEALFRKAEASAFLKGKNNRSWSADFDWLIKDANIAKVLDGNYDDNKGTGQKPSGRAQLERETSNRFDEMKKYRDRLKTAGNSPEVKAGAEALRVQLTK